MLEIDKRSDTPVYIQIYEELKRQIITGEKKAGERLSATRSLSEDYHISRNTVLAAYQQLESEGFIYSRIGSGYYVEEIPEISERKKTESALRNRKENNTEYLYDFRYGNIEPNVYRTRGFRKALKEAVNEIEDYDALRDPDPKGLFELREAIADHLREVRGIEADADQILVTGGHHYSLKLLCELFPEGYESLAVEDPGHRDTREVFMKAGYRILPIPLDENGMKVDRIMEYEKILAYVTPSHQFPLGAILPVGRRFHLLQWAYNSDSFLIEDDYDSELRFKERPVPSLYSLDFRGRVIYLGSFSKSLSPDLRVSYIVFPRNFDLRILDDRAMFSSGTSLLIQLTLKEYLQSSEYRKRISRIRKILRKKHNTIIDFLNARYGEQIRIYGIGGGTHFVLKVPTEMSSKEIADLFHREDVAVYPIDEYCFDREIDTRGMFMIGYSGIPLSSLDDALLHLQKGIDNILNAS